MDIITPILFDLPSLIMWLFVLWTLIDPPEHLAADLHRGHGRTSFIALATVAILAVATGILRLAHWNP